MSDAKAKPNQMTNLSTEFRLSLPVGWGIDVVAGGGHFDLVILTDHQHVPLLLDEYMAQRSLMPSQKLHGRQLSSLFRKCHLSISGLGRRGGGGLMARDSLGTCCNCWK